MTYKQQFEWIEDRKQINTALYLKLLVCSKGWKVKSIFLNNFQQIAHFVWCFVQLCFIWLHRLGIQIEQF